MRYLAILVGMGFLLFVGLSSIVFSARNPKANQMTVITHFVDVVTFKKLDKFQ